MLRKLVADLTLDKEMLTEVIKKDLSAERKRAIVDFVRTCFQVSIRRVCRAVPVDRLTYHYRSIRPNQTPLRKRIREIAETHARYGYRRIHVVLRRDGWLVNVRRVRRLYRLEGLQMRLQTGAPACHGQAPFRSQQRHRTQPGLGHGLDA